MKNLPTLTGNGGGKTKDQGLDFLVITLNTLHPCRGKIEQFDYCELPSDQVSRSFLVVFGDSVDLVCSCSRGIRSYKLDVHPKRSNSLVRLVYTINRANLVSSMRIAEKVVSCTAKRVISCTAAILVLPG